MFDPDGLVPDATGDGSPGSSGVSPPGLRGPAVGMEVDEATVEQVGAQGEKVLCNLPKLL